MKIIIPWGPVTLDTEFPKPTNGRQQIVLYWPDKDNDKSKLDGEDPYAFIPARQPFVGRYEFNPSNYLRWNFNFDSNELPEFFKYWSKKVIFWSIQEAEEVPIDLKRETAN
jgi:hypothetical protein